VVALFEFPHSRKNDVLCARRSQLLAQSGHAEATWGCLLLDEKRTPTLSYYGDGARLPNQARQKGFVDFVGDVAPREANVVQVPVGRSGEFLTVLVALPPDRGRPRGSPCCDALQLSSGFRPQPDLN